MRYLPHCLAALAITVAGIGSVKAQDTIRIGAMAPLSGGAYSVVGEDMRRGFAMAVDEVNGKGGINGKKVEMILGDDQANPTVGVGLAQRLLVRDKVAAIVGIYSSTVAMAVAQAVAQYKKPLFIVGASAPIVEDAVGKEPWYFHFYPYSYYIAESVSEFLKGLQPRPSTVAIAYENGVYGTSGVKLLKEALDNGGFKVVAEESFKSGSPSVLPLLSRLKAANPDILVTQAYAADNILIVKQSREVNFAPKLMVMPEIFSQEFYPAVGKSGDGVLGYTTWIPESGYPASVSWMEEFKRKFPERPDPQDWAPMSYTAMMLILDAIKSAGTEPDALIKSLAAAETDSPFGKLKFVNSRNGVHQLLTKLSIVQYQNGKKAIVYPAELAGTSKVQYPVPAWKDR